MGGLAAHTTQDRMYDHFSQYGPVQDCILMMDRTTGRSRCFGFVTMKDPYAVDIILGEDQIMDGKKVDCKPAVPRDSPPVVASESLSHYRTKKMFVGGLPTDITEEAFRNFFGQFGPIEDSVIMFDRETKRPRGFGFITFMSEDAVERVLQNYENNFISGKWVECKKATPKDIGFMDRAKSGFPNVGNIPQYMMYPYYNQTMYDTPQYNQYEQTYRPDQVTETVQAPTPKYNQEEEIKNNLLEYLLGEDTEDNYSSPFKTM